MPKLTVSGSHLRLCRTHSINGLRKAGSHLCATRVTQELLALSQLSRVRNVNLGWPEDCVFGSHQGERSEGGEVRSRSRAVRVCLDQAPGGLQLFQFCVALSLLCDVTTS